MASEYEDLARYAENRTQAEMYWGKAMKLRKSGGPENVTLERRTRIEYSRIFREIVRQKIRQASRINEQVTFPAGEISLEAGDQIAIFSQTEPQVLGASVVSQIRVSRPNREPLPCTIVITDVGEKRILGQRTKVMILGKE